MYQLIQRSSIVALASLMVSASLFIAGAPSNASAAGETSAAAPIVQAALKGDRHFKILPRVHRPGGEAHATDYCRRNGDFLVVRVKNTGKLRISRATVGITFHTRNGDQSDRKRVRRLAKGATRDLKFEIPSGGFSPDLFFSIRRNGQTIVKDICIG